MTDYQMLEKELNDLITSAETAIKMLRGDDPVEKLDAVPYLLNRITVARKVLVQTGQKHGMD